MKRHAVNRRDTTATKAHAKLRRRIQRLRRENTYTLIGTQGKIMRGRVIIREGRLALLRII